MKNKKVDVIFEQQLKHCELALESISEGEGNSVSRQALALEVIARCLFGLLKSAYEDDKDKG